MKNTVVLGELDRCTGAVPRLLGDLNHPATEVHSGDFHWSNQRYHLDHQMQQEPGYIVNFTGLSGRSCFMLLAGDVQSRSLISQNTRQDACYLTIY